MDAGETMVEVIRPTATLGITPVSNVTTASGDTHEGIKQYYIQKIEELQVREIEEKSFLKKKLSFLVKCSRKKSKFTSSSSQTK
jgi:hypothetical protein